MRTSTAMTLGEAAKACGKEKPTILRAIQKGRLSAVKDDKGNWAIEPVELFRVFPAVPDAGPDNPLSVTGDVTTGNPHPSNDATPETGSSAAVIAALRDQIADLKEDRARERANADSLREQLADERAERGRLVGVIERQSEQVRLLTDERTQPIEPKKKRSGWLWGR